LCDPLLQIPVYFIWVNKISYLTYAFAGVVGSEFQGLTLVDPSTGEAGVVCVQRGWGAYQGSTTLQCAPKFCCPTGICTELPKG
jgi:hypothetical protein